MTLEVVVETIVAEDERTLFVSLPTLRHLLRAYDSAGLTLVDVGADLHRLEGESIAAHLEAGTLQTIRDAPTQRRRFRL